MRRIIIVGSGQIGSRYLQGMAKLTEPSEIWAYDISQDSLDRARQRWEEVPSAIKHRLKMTKSFEEIKGTFDLAILSCTADSRPHLVSILSKQATVRAWLLEKLLAQSIIGLQVIKDSIPENVPAWVNTPMMTYPLYHKLIPRVNGAPIDARFFNITGVACNLIHYVDFVARLRNASIESVCVDGLQTWTPYVKRPWLFDVEGRTRISFSDGSLLSISGVSANQTNGVDFSIRSLRDTSSFWNIYEQAGKAVSADGEELNGQGFCFQSDSTPILVEKIFSNSDTGLPTLDESLRQHKPILGAFLRHWNQVMPNKRTELPIT